MTRGMRLALAAAALGAVAGPVFAQSQSAMNAAAAREAAAADQALNAQYRTTTAGLSVPSRTLLRNAQRGWLSFRDGQCKYEASGVTGGSAYPMVHSACVKRMTEERTRQLRAAAQCQEGDLSCPR